jgi:hypothetical protein
VKVVLQKKGQRGKKPLQRRAKFKFELVEVSKEPGVCLNWPPKYQVKKEPDFDLKIDPRIEKNPIIIKEGKIAKDGQSAETPKGMQEAYIAITSYDWGAYGKLKVTAILDDDNWPVEAHLEDKPDVNALKIPQDDNNNHIADAWERRIVILPSELAESDEDSLPEGDGTPGDGFSLYEEYRGFRVKGRHIRTDPNQKDVFIRDQNKLGIGYYGFSFLRPHVVDWNEFYSDVGSNDPNQFVINFNYHTAHLGDQHLIYMMAADCPGCLGEAIPEESPIGPPKTCQLVRIDINKLNRLGWEKTSATIAHELAHCSNVSHHGDNNYKVKEYKYHDRKTGFYEIQKSPVGRTVAAMGGQNSGDMECVMRYNSAYLYETPFGPYSWEKIIPGEPSTTVYGEPYPREPAGLIFCEAQAGTGPLGPAKRGNCLAQFCVTDVNPCKSERTKKQEN